MHKAHTLYAGIVFLSIAYRASAPHAVGERVQREEQAARSDSQRAEPGAYADAQPRRAVALAGKEAQLKRVRESEKPRERRARSLLPCVVPVFHYWRAGQEHAGPGSGGGVQHTSGKQHATTQLGIMSAQDTFVTGVSHK